MFIINVQLRLDAIFAIVLLVCFCVTFLFHYSSSTMSNHHSTIQILSFLLFYIGFLLSLPVKFNTCHRHPLCSSWMWRTTDKHTNLKSVSECACFVGSFIFGIGIQVCVGYILYHAIHSTVTAFVFIAVVFKTVAQEMCWKTMTNSRNCSNWTQLAKDAD
jgi:hypothetical protein